MSLLHIRHIACIFDFTEGSELALSTAGTIALQFSAELHCIHLIQRIAAFGGLMLGGLPTYHTCFYDLANDMSYQNALQSLLRNSLPPEILPTINLLFGLHKSILVELFHEYSVDLLIIGTNPKAPWWSNIFSPSIIPHIVQIAPCPLLITTVGSNQG
jgi:hypothetical protein